MRRFLLLSLLLTLCTTTLYAQDIKRPSATRVNTTLRSAPKAKKQQTSTKPLRVKSPVSTFNHRRGKLERQVRVILELDLAMTKITCIEGSIMHPTLAKACKKRNNHK